MGWQTIKVLLVRRQRDTERLITGLLAEDDWFTASVQAVDLPGVGSRAALTDAFDVALLELSPPLEQMAATLERFTRTIPHLPVVALIDDDDPHLGRALLDRGADEYLPRHGLTPALLVRALRYALDRKEAARAHTDGAAFHREFFDYFGDAIFLHGMDGRFVDVNREACERLGYSREELLAMSPLDIDALDFRSEYDGRVQQLHEAGDLTFETVHVCRDGTRIPTEIISSVVDCDGQPCVLSVARDISRRQAIENAEREQRILAEGLYTTISALNSSLDIDRIMDQILTNVGRVVPHDAVSISRTDGVHSWLAYWRGRGWQETRVEFGAQRFLVADTPYFARMLETGRAVVVPDTREDAQWMRPPDANWVMSYAGMPIRVRGQVIGFLNLDHHEPGFYTEAHVERLQLFAEQAAIALENARLHQEIQDYAAELEQRVEQRTLEARLAREHFEAIIHSTHDVVIIMTLDGVITETNPAFEQQFKLAADAAAGQKLWDLVSTENRPAVEQAFATVIETQDLARIECLMSGADGAVFDADLMLSPIVGSDGKILDVVCALRDVTPYKQLERQLRAMLEQQAELGELKTRLITMISHELRTPLALIQLSSDLLSRYHDRLAPDDRLVELGKIVGGVQRITTILNNVLEITRAETEEIKLVPQILDLAGLCRDVVQQVVDDPSRVTIEVTGDVSQVVLDRDRVTAILVNLLENAVQYSPEGAPIVVKLARKRGGVEIEVRDRGVGIPDADLPHIFEIFHRARNVEHIAGAGLGLPLVKNAVELHTGQITIDSEEGVGTTVRVSLPFLPSAQIA